jgi:hypothetical protein
MKPPSERPSRTPAEMRKRTAEQRQYSAWLETLRTAAKAGDRGAANQLDRHMTEIAMQSKVGRKVMLR